MKSLTNSLLITALALVVVPGVSPVLAQSSRSAAGVTFAQAEFFLPRPRYRCCPWTIETDEGVVNNTDAWPRDWDSYNQTWSVRLVPADETAALMILTAQPPAPADGMRPARLEGVTPLDLERVNTH